MAEQKHTPGPWTAELGEAYKVRGADGSLVCTVSQLGGIHAYRRRTAEEAVANCGLLARAPALASRVEKLEEENERLRSLLGQFAGVCGSPHFDSVRQASMVRDLVGEARAALGGK